MLNYQKINILFIAIIIPLSILAIFQIVSFFLLIALVLLYLLILSYGVVNIQSDFYIKSIQKLNDEKQVLLTFDDGPHPIYTPLILDLLDEYQVKAMFLVIGEQVEKSPLLLGEIKSRGHMIGNHSWSHDSYFDFFSVSKMIDEINRTNDVIEEIIGERPVFFRPPFGITNPRIAKLLRKTGMKSVSWSFRSYDTKSRSNQRIIDQIKKHIRGGDILLFHDPIPRTYDVLKEILPWLKENYDLSTVDINN